MDLKKLLGDKHLGELIRYVHNTYPHDTLKDAVKAGFVLTEKGIRREVLEQFIDSIDWEAVEKYLKSRTVYTLYYQGETPVSILKITIGESIPKELAASKYSFIDNLLVTQIEKIEGSTLVEYGESSNCISLDNFVTFSTLQAAEKEFSAGVKAYRVHLCNRLAVDIQGDKSVGYLKQNLSKLEKSFDLHGNI